MYADSLSTGAGDDTINPGRGNDNVNGGAGNDLLIVDYSGSTSNVGINSRLSPSSWGGFNGYLTRDQDQVYYQNIERFQITGTSANDNIIVGSGNDTVNGGGGNDTINTGEGNDLICGVSPISINPGRGEVDSLTGGAGRDRFILGDANWIGYDDGDPSLPGNSDYAFIIDFAPFNDIIQLRGSSSAYLLTVSEGHSKIYIDKPGSEPDELIASLQNCTGLSLTSNYFDYIPLPIITLAVSPNSVPEDGTSNFIYTFVRTGSTTNALTVNYGISGTADSSDYTGSTPGTGKTITFAAGSATATLTIDPTVDSTIEPDETVALILTAGTGYSIGTTAAIVGTILNDDISSLTTYTLGAGQSSLLLLGSDQINGIGNDLGNTITGNSNNNRLVGLLGADSLTGGGTADNDLFVYNSLNESPLGTGNSFDVITDFNRMDRIVRPPSQATTTRLSSPIGNISSLTALQIAGLLSTSTFSANSVAAFTATGRGGTFIAMNDGRTGFQADSDAIIFLQNYILNTTNFVDFA